MKVYRELNQAMRAGKIRGHNVRNQNSAGLVVFSGIVASSLILVMAVLISLSAR